MNNNPQHADLDPDERKEIPKGKWSLAKKTVTFCVGAIVTAVIGCIVGIGLSPYIHFSPKPPKIVSSQSSQPPLSSTVSSKASLLGQSSGSSDSSMDSNPDLPNSSAVVTSLPDVMEVGQLPENDSVFAEEYVGLQSSNPLLVVFPDDSEDPYEIVITNDFVIYGFNITNDNDTVLSIDQVSLEVVGYSEYTKARGQRVGGKGAAGEFMNFLTIIDSEKKEYGSIFSEDIFDSDLGISREEIFRHPEKAKKEGYARVEHNDTERFKLFFAVVTPGIYTARVNINYDIRGDHYSTSLEEFKFMAIDRSVSQSMDITGMPMS